MKKNINLQIKEANNIINKTIGIMFKKRKINYGILFKNVRSIHTFFCFQKIDVIMLDKNYKILYIFNDLKGNKIIIKSKPVFYTLELPSGYIKNNNININDILNLTNIKK